MRRSLLIIGHSYLINQQRQDNDFTCILQHFFLICCQLFSCPLFLSILIICFFDFSKCIGGLNILNALFIYLFSVYYLLYSNMYGGVQEFKHPQIVLLCICCSSFVCIDLLLFLLCNVPDSAAIVCIFLYLLFVILLICVSFNC